MNGYGPYLQHVSTHNEKEMRDDIQIELKQHLDPTEKLIWTGQPKKGVVFQTSDIFMIPFSILWCGFAIFWTISATSAGAPFFFSLFGLLFVFVGLIFVFGRFIIDAKQRENTYYGITQNRIIIKSGIFSKHVKSINIRTLSDIEFNEKNNGTGTISIGPKNPFMFWGNGMTWWPGMKTSPSLQLIPNVRSVYNQIIKLQNEK